MVGVFSGYSKVRFWIVVWSQTRVHCKYNHYHIIVGLVLFMVFNATFNNISVIFWQSVLLVEETRLLGENHWPVASHWQTLSDNVVSSTPCHIVVRYSVLLNVIEFVSAVQSVPITTNVVSLNPAHGEVYSIQHYVIKFVSDLRQVGGFLWLLLVYSTNKTDRHDITETLLKIALSIIILTLL